jgi:hypothetical protein
MDLKEELKGLKADLEKDFNEKSQLDIQTAIEEFEKKAKGEYELELKAIKDDFQEKSKAMQDHLDALDIRLKQAKGEVGNEVKTFNAILGETIKENAEAIKNF